MRIKKRCCLCGADYYTGNGKAKYCSDECRKEATRRRQRTWYEEHPEYHKNYSIDHPEVRERFTERHPNYARDRSRNIRGSQEHTKQCIVCGKTFVTWNPNKKTCSDECKQANIKEKAKEREKKRARDPEKEHKKWIRQRYGSEEAHQQHLRDLEQKRQEQKEQTRKRKEAEKEAKRISKKCIVCGNDFKTFNPKQKTCCKECGKKLSYARKWHRIPKKQIADKDITLEALYRRDSGVCYLCGKKCDWDDKDGNIVGPLYPSIDHLIPVSHGGFHAWDNIRLAHFACNVKKSDKIIPNIMASVPENAYALKHKPKNQKKRTLQFSKEGVLLATFESTADAERKTGLKQRSIQNCARGETMSCGGYKWKYA